MDTIKKPRTYKDAYSNAVLQTKLDKASALNDISTSNRSANQYMQNYLAQRGIQGSGMAQSVINNNQQQVQNQMNQYTPTDDYDYDGEFMNDKNDMLGAYKSKYEEYAGTDNEMANNYLNHYKNIFNSRNATELQDAMMVGEKYEDSLNRVTSIDRDNLIEGVSTDSSGSENYVKYQGETYLKVGDSKKGVKGLPVWKEGVKKVKNGEIKKADNGKYYVCVGTSKFNRYKWVELKKV